ncbi:MAG: hypothetical protein KAT62_02440, partial [Desulfuromonadales bacterium]|nr:hypothetical protein [Desulfuromonadales bacterium]
IKRLRGGVDVYAAQANVQIDAEIVKKGRFRMKTSLRLLSPLELGSVFPDPGSFVSGHAHELYQSLYQSSRQLS